MTAALFILACVVVMMALAMARAGLWLWALAAAVAALTWQSGIITGVSAWPLTGWTIGLWTPAAIFVLLAIPPIRRNLIIVPIFAMVRRILPKVSDTEQQALDAGTVAFDAELFSGRPDWNKLKQVPPIQLTPDERAFLDGPCEELCRRVDDWDITHVRADLPPELAGTWLQRPDVARLLAR